MRAGFRGEGEAVGMGSLYPIDVDTIPSMASQKLMFPTRAEATIALPWIEQAITLEREGQEEKSLDLIFDHLDEMLLTSRFDECDSVLPLFPVGSLTNAQLLTALTATLPARLLLPNRTRFFDAVKSTLTNRGADAEAMLVGLE